MAQHCVRFRILMVFAGLMLTVSSYAAPEDRPISRRNWGRCSVRLMLLGTALFAGGLRVGLVPYYERRRAQAQDSVWRTRLSELRTIPLHRLQDREQALKLLREFSYLNRMVFLTPASVNDQLEGGLAFFPEMAERPAQLGFRSFTDDPEWMRLVAGLDVNNTRSAAMIYADLSPAHPSCVPNVVDTIQAEIYWKTLEHFRVAQAQHFAKLCLADLVLVRYQNSAYPCEPIRYFGDGFFSLHP